MASPSKLILIVQTECLDQPKVHEDRFDFSNSDGSSEWVAQEERINGLWEDLVLKRSSIQCDFYLEGVPTSFDQRELRNNEDPTTSTAQLSSSVTALHPQNIMALYRQSIYPCSIPQNLLSLNLTEWKPWPQKGGEREIRASFTNCHFLVDPEPMLGGDAVALGQTNVAFSSHLYLPLFPIHDSFPVQYDDSNSMPLVKEVPLSLDVSHAKRLFTQYYLDHVTMELVDHTNSTNTSSGIESVIRSNDTEIVELTLDAINESVAVISSPTPSFAESTECATDVKNKMHRTVATTIALSTTALLQKTSLQEMLQTTKSFVDTSQKHSLWHNERHHMLEQMLKQEMFQIHVILLTLGLATFSILLFLGYKVLRQPLTEPRKQLVLRERESHNTSPRQSSPSSMAPGIPTGISKSTARHLSPLSMELDLCQTDLPPLSPIAHPVTEVGSSSSPCATWWKNRQQRHLRRSTFIGETYRQRPLIRPTNDFEVKVTPEPLHPPPDIQSYPRVVSPCGNESVQSEQARKLSLIEPRGNKSRTATHPLKPGSPKVDPVAHHSTSFLEEYW